MTTLPSRINHLHKILDSLKQQTMRPDKIFLWVPKYYKRLDEKISEIPAYLKNYPIDIQRCEDKGPLTKLYFTHKLANYRDIIVSVDDDIIVPPNWLGNLVNACVKEQCAVAYRGRILKDIFHPKYNDSTLVVNRKKPTKVHIITGTWGFAYRKYMLENKYNEDIGDYRECEDAHMNDDLWFSAKLACNKIDRLILPNPGIVLDKENQKRQSLWSINSHARYNDNILKHTKECYIGDLL
jgi:hypothetical protein